MRSGIANGFAALGMLASVAFGEDVAAKPKNQEGAGVMAIQKHVEALMAKPGTHVLTIESKGKDDLVQVAKEMAADKTALTVMLSYPFEEPVAQALAKAGVTPPAAWKLLEFEEGAYATYSTSGSDAAPLATFVDAFFAKFLKASADTFSMEQM